jgi:hypothetical protein
MDFQAQFIKETGKKEKEIYYSEVFDAYGYSLAYVGYLESRLQSAIICIKEILKNG